MTLYATSVRWNNDGRRRTERVIKTVFICTERCVWYALKQRTITRVQIMMFSADTRPGDVEREYSTCITITGRTPLRARFRVRQFRVRLSPAPLRISPRPSHSVSCLSSVRSTRLYRYGRTCYRRFGTYTNAVETIRNEEKRDRS